MATSDASDEEAEWSASALDADMQDGEGDSSADDAAASEDAEGGGSDDDDFESDGAEVLSTRLRSSRRLSAGGSSRRIDSYFTRADSNDANDDSASDVPLARKKRKQRLRTADDVSTAAGDGGDDHARRSKRRNIADVRGDEELDASTRRARAAERARARHVIDFEQLADAVAADAGDVTADAAATTTTSEPLLCLNVRADGSTPSGAEGSDDAPVFAHASVSARLKKHQVVGARFLWSHVGVEPEGFGCVLADFMGLGKTLQVITVVQAFLSKMTRRRHGVDGDVIGGGDAPLAPRHKHVLILAPTICVRNWEAEVVKWLGKKDARRLGLATLESSREKKVADRVHVVKQWHRRGGLLIMGYELYRILVLQASGDEKIAAGNAKHAAQIRDMYACLANPGPDLIVLDEGHRVRDRKSKLVKALTHVRTPRRIILTGYPLQNHLEEYWTMVNFARPDYLGTLEEFKNRFVDPIKNGQCIDSSDADLRLARQRAYVLTRELKPLVLRRDQQYLFKQLPPKKEWVLICKLTDAQKKLYRTFLKDGVPTRGNGDKVDVLGGYHISMAISNHPDVLCESYRTLEDEMRKNPSKFTGKNARFNMLGEDIDDFRLYDSPAARQKEAASVPKRSSPAGTSETEGEDSEGDLLDQLAAPAATSSRAKAVAPGPQHRLSFAADFLQSYEQSLLETSGKMMILMEILAECREIGDRVILFSQSIPTLNTIEKMIAMANRKARRHTHRINYLRIDGSTPAQERFRMIAQFNDLEEDVDLILISTKAGGEGINLCAGNRIVIFDVCWNPSNDSQSMCRSYRFGQTKNVYVYRFVTTGTMEKKVYDLQILKEGVSKRVVDDRTTERKFKLADRQKYFDLDEFEESLRQQHKTVAPTANAGGGVEGFADGILSRPNPETDGVLQRVLAKFNALSIGGDSAAVVSSSPDTDTASTVASEGGGWIMDWFEQETMFEEDLDQQCTPLEQKEIMESHLYLKSMRRLRKNGSHTISREGVLFAKCPMCSHSNEVFPERTTGVPVPSKIDCVYCRNALPTAGATDVPPAQQLPYAGYGHRGFPGAMPPMAGGAVPMVVDAGGAGVPGTLPGGHVLPPHLMAIYQEQQRKQQQLQQERAAQQQREQQRIAEIRERERQIAIENQRRKREEELRRRQFYELKDRCLLVLRRGMAGCQELKRSAEACGAKIAIEVNAQTTDIVSAMSKEETLKFLKLYKLPSDVELRDEAWLRAEIAKARGEATAPSSSAAAGAAPGAPGDESSSSAATSSPSRLAPPPASSHSAAPDMSSETIDLFDSDNDGDDDDASRPPAPERQEVAPALNERDAAAPVAEAVDDDDDDVIEIL